MTFDAVKGIALAGSLLTVAATLVSNLSREKQMESAVAKEVAKALKKED